MNSFLFCGASSALISNFSWVWWFGSIAFARGLNWCQKNQPPKKWRGGRGIESSCAKQRRWYSAFQRTLRRLAGNFTAYCPTGFAFRVWFSLMQGKPRWFCLEILPLTSPAAEVKRERAAAPPLRTNSSLPLTASWPATRRVMGLQRRCDRCWAPRATPLEQGRFLWRVRESRNALEWSCHCSDTVASLSCNFPVRLCLLVLCPWSWYCLTHLFTSLAQI